MGDPVPLTTTRLRLTAPGTSDVDAIYEACQDPDIQYYTTVPSPYTRQDAETFVGLVAEWWQAGTEHVWAIRPGDELVGVVGLHHISEGGAELGFWMAPSGRGHGYMAEAASAVIDFAFGPMRLERIQWQAVVGNAGSAGVAQRLGFQLEGVRRRSLPRHGTSGAHGRADGWVAGLLSTDPRTPQHWGL
ncbi:acetyltransferase [Microbacterium faecale]|uniref:Acetyltransferase n=1 Tax=Microbacterium faecale TaxID=1804630 RepID=A0A916Y6S7_9MICO|nr:GNAT family N-acetyltransferase [Microbacterium faecale]GGD32386.1 acetyltransferase [Microbacterium faecale]